MDIEKKRKKIEEILEDAACDICDCDCGGRYSTMTELDGYIATSKIDRDELKAVAERIIKVFQEEDWRR